MIEGPLASDGGSSCAPPLLTEVCWSSCRSRCLLGSSNRLFSFTEPGLVSATGVGPSSDSKAALPQTLSPVLLPTRSSASCTSAEKTLRIPEPARARYVSSWTYRSSSAAHQRTSTRWNEILAYRRASSLGGHGDAFAHEHGLAVERPLGLLRARIASSSSSARQKPFVADRDESEHADVRMRSLTPGARLGPRACCMRIWLLS